MLFATPDLASDPYTRALRRLFFLMALATASGVAAAPNVSEPAVASVANAIDTESVLQRGQATIGHRPADAAFLTADGRAVRLSEFRGKPVVLSPIYTSCYHICATTTQRLARAVRTAREALGQTSFAVLTIGFDTPNDTPGAMAEFAKQQKLGIAGWEFLSSDGATMKQLMDDIGFRYAPAPHGFDHVIQATVLDAEGKIYRHVYGGSFETPLLVEPLKELVFGTPKSGSMLASIGNRVKLFCTVYDPSSDRYRFDYSIFLGLFIGFTSLGALTAVVVREWRRGRPKAS